MSSKFNKRVIQPDFENVKNGSRFEINRPSYIAGGNINNKFNAPPLKPNNRAGLGNYDITRTSNFRAPQIRARDAIDFDKLQAIDIETQGAKIQLSDKTIEQIFSTKVPDMQDILWINEKNRLTALYLAQGLSPTQIEIELNTNKPLGREQRKINSTQNIGQASASMADKLSALEQEVKDGRAESRAQQARLAGYFANVLADTNAIATLTRLQLTDLGQALARIGVPTNHKALGIEPRFVDDKFYFANMGIINLLLFSKVRETPNNDDFGYDLMVKNFAAYPSSGLPAMQLGSAVRSLKKDGTSISQRRFLDLERGGVISVDQLRAEAAADNQGGYNGPNFSIEATYR